MALALELGVGKRELLRDYYPDELPALLRAWRALHAPPDDAPEQTDALRFLGEGGERL